MELEWRTLQFFLDDDGVCEVQADTTNPKKVRCTCALFYKSAKCKHTAWLRKNAEENNGVFEMDIPEDLDVEIIEDAWSDSDKFRDFILKYGRVQVI